MRLLIVSHTPHYLENGVPVGWGPTVREIDYLATLFEEIVHVAPLHDGKPEGALAYQSDNIRFRPVRPSGGERFVDKLSILAHLPSYVRVLNDEWRGADVVHVRCPANISMIALLMLALRRHPRLRWVKYAGNWQPSGYSEAWSYAFQRWFLSHRLHRGLVTINGRWKNQRKHVYSFFNPCLTEDEIAEAREMSLTKELSEPIRLIFVGRLERAKGTDRALKILARIKEAGIEASLDLVGDGAERSEFERLAVTLGISRNASFHGWLPRTALAPLYSQAHILILPTDSEGYPKVLSEAMAYGVVPIASKVSCIPQYLEDLGVGKTYAPTDVQGFAEAIEWYVGHPSAWQQESRRGTYAAESFSYTRYLDELCEILEMRPRSLSGAVYTGESSF
jgi:glycosyltransferase involved in cell wall biosynthesis